jgi:chromosome transmission fidelity protein 1
MLEELGQVLVNICTVVPDGVVVFFPSYHFEEHVHTVWRNLGIDKRIEAKKKIFREPRQANKVEDTLRTYAECIENNFPEFDQNRNPINKPKGALLSCVVGGKMSEGINFSDGLGRCVVVVGLPYPNSKDPVLKEKMNYINQKAQEVNTKDAIKLITGSEYYENLCMKAVNQSIGRSIRHARDYATIVMIDQRYTRSSIVNKLPKWISSRLIKPDSNTNFGANFARIAQFFRSKQHDQLDIEIKRQAQHMQRM